MRHRTRLCLLACTAAVLAAVGLRAPGGVSSLLGFHQQHQVIAAHDDIAVAPIATRAETIARDEAKRPVLWFGSVFALVGCAFALLTVGRGRRGVVMRGAELPVSVDLPAACPRGPPRPRP